MITNSIELVETVINNRIPFASTNINKLYSENVYEKEQQFFSSMENSFYFSISKQNIFSRGIASIFKR